MQSRIDRTFGYINVKLHDLRCDASIWYKKYRTIFFKVIKNQIEFQSLYAKLNIFIHISRSFIALRHVKNQIVHLFFLKIIYTVN